VIDKSPFRKEDSKFLAHLRALSIFIIVFGHVGGFWVFGPPSKFLLVFLSFFFFISGVVSFVSIERYRLVLKWMLRRFLSLYVPYLLFCLVPLGVYLFFYHAFPSFSLGASLDWLIMYPAASYKLYPLGHLWFLQTLMIITVFFAPLMFVSFKKSIIVPWIYFVGVSLLAFFKLVGIITHDFSFCGISIYKPLVYSLFYVLAWFFVNGKSILLHVRFVLSMLCVFMFCLLFVLFKNNSPFFEGHVHPPDLYFVSASILCIIFLVRIQKSFNLLFSVPILRAFSKFFFEHTYSIYLLHTFSIFLVETVFNFLLPNVKNFSYGLIKLSLVLLLTSMFALLFDLVVKRVTRQLLSFLGV